MIKFLFLILVTVCVTVVVFRLVRQSNSLPRAQHVNSAEKVSLLRFESIFLLNNYLVQVFLEVKKIDWHNYTQIEAEQRRNGIGERGKPASLDERDSLAEKEALYKVNGFNAMLSDKISLQRCVFFLRS